MSNRSLFVGLLLISSTGAAQGPEKPRGPGAMTRDPVSLPGDILPPPLAASMAPPQAAGSPPAPQSSAPVQNSIPAAAALRAMQTAIAQCRTDGYAVGSAVADTSGTLIAGLQSDEAPPGLIFHAMRKNLVAVEFGMPSSSVRNKLRARDFAVLARIKPNMTVFPGAVPLFANNKLIGAIGVSGAPEAEADEKCAAAGAASFSSR